MITREHMHAVRRLEIRARRRVDNLFGGSYNSAFKGRGIEFAEVREYEPGDDVRTIDWNVTARSGHPYVKRFMEERQLTIVLALDCSATTGFGAVDRTKLEMMTEVGAVLTLAGVRSNDRVGLCLFGARGLAPGRTLHVSPSKGRTHSMRIIRELIEADPGSDHADIPGVLTEIGRTHKRRSVVVLISDFLSGINNEPQPTWARPLRMLARRHEIVAIRCTDPRETELPRAGTLRMHDPVSGRRFVIDTDSRRVRERYRARALEETGRIVDALDRARVDHTELSTGGPAIDDLARFLDQRGRRR